PFADHPVGFRGLEAVRLSLDPSRHEPAVRSASYAHPRRIDIRTSRSHIDGLHEILVIFGAPTSTSAVSEIGAVAARATWVREEHEHSGGGEILKLVEPVLTVRRVRTTMDVQHQRVFLPW